MPSAYDWTLNAGQVITGALRKLAVLPSGGSATTAQSNDAKEALNALIKAFHAEGMPLWAISSLTFTVVSGTSSYEIGNSKTINTELFPLKVIQALRTELNSNAVPLNVENRYDFNILPNVSSTGIPVTVYYQPLSTYGVVYLWPTPNDSTTTITLHYQRPFADVDTTADAFDFPPYWIQALIYNLAWALAPEYGIPPTDRDKLAAEAKYWKEEALSYGSEEGSIFFTPATRPPYGIH